VRENRTHGSIGGRWPDDHPSKAELAPDDGECARHLSAIEQPAAYLTAHFRLLAISYAARRSVWAAAGDPSLISERAEASSEATTSGNRVPGAVVWLSSWGLPGSSRGGDGGADGPGAGQTG